MKRAVRTGPGMDRPPQACADATAYLSPATPSFPAILVHKMDCQQQQPTRPEEGTGHKFHSSPPHLTESNLRRRRQTSLNSHHRHQIASSLPSMKGSGAVTIASTVITAAASYSTAVSGSSLLDPPKQQSTDQVNCTQVMVPYESYEA
ncbi:hypothetical protein BHM03_00023438 [Ensete ventricosum]|nr:hypothetical protein BHM03_00023438 [Ensete ventricosum]